MPESSWGAAAAQVAETLGISADAVMTEEEMAGFRERFAEAMNDRRPQMLPPRPPLTPGEVRQLLRECAVVVKPGETLIIQVPENWTVEQAMEMQRVLNWADDHGPVWPFRTLVVPGERLGVAEATLVSGDPGPIEMDRLWP